MKFFLEKYNWYRAANISVTGYILIGDNIIRDKDLIDYFSNSYTINDFENKLIEANGQFSVIVDNKKEIWLACDRVRNYPVFYTQNDGERIISDDCYSCLKEKSNAQINSTAADAFLAAGYVPDKLTLIHDIYQVEAGSFVTLGEDVSIKFYHTIFNTTVIDVDAETAKRKLRDLLESVFSNQLNAVKNKYIAISLSGGYDSRLIALMAKKYHPDNLLCFSYGRRNNPEVLRAERVAKNIGVKWINIEYNSEMIRGFINDKTFQEYYPYASNLTSMFYMQDYFAVKYLKENKIVPDDCVFIPGHSGDFLAGSHLTKAMDKNLPVNSLAKLIYSKNFFHLRFGKGQKAKIRQLVKERMSAENIRAWMVYENWNLKERQSKFIVNSAKVYPYFGYEYILPFWDIRLIDFFSELPFVLKLGKKLYNHVLKEYFFEEKNLNFSDDIFVTPFRKNYQKIKDYIKPYLPYNLVTLLSEQKNIVLYDEITKVFREDMGEENVIRPVQANFYNSYLIQWYLFKTREYLKSL